MDVLVWENLCQLITQPDYTSLTLYSEPVSPYQKFRSRLQQIPFAVAWIAFYALV
jgi:dethiobiotin synthetase